VAKAKVISEYYRLVDVKRDPLKVFEPNTSWKEMYWEALHAIKETGYAAVYIQRVTKWVVNVEDLTEEDREGFAFLLLPVDQTEGPFEGESLTGEYAVSIPQHMPVELSRYHPVSGWLVPDEIDV
jgi:hypothetical protein